MSHAFSRRFCTWSLNQASAEVDRSYASIRGIANPAVHRLLSFASSFSRSEQEFLMESLVRRFHHQPLTAANNAVLAKIDSIPLPSHHGRLSKTDRNYLKSCLQEAALFGTKVEEENESIWWQALQIGSLSLKTVFDIGGRSRNLTYSTIAEDEKTGQTLTNVSVLSWLGISSQTTWYGDHQSVDSIFTSCSEVYKMFLKAAPDLLK
jgi:hypothetical protein